MPPTGTRAHTYPMLRGERLGCSFVAVRNAAVRKRYNNSCSIDATLLYVSYCHSRTQAKPRSAVWAPNVRRASVYRSVTRAGARPSAGNISQRWDVRLALPQASTGWRASSRRVCRPHCRDTRACAKPGNTHGAAGSPAFAAPNDRIDGRMKSGENAASTGERGMRTPRL